MVVPNAKYVLAVSGRQYRVWVKFLGSSMVTNVANPVLFLFAFGFGLGNFIDEMSGMSYLTFVTAGMFAYGAAFAASFETTIGSFTRYFTHGNWDAILSTPVTLTELLMGEVLWASAKAVISAISVLVVGWFWGGVPSLMGGILALPIVFLAAICFACVGLAATSYARGYEFFSYFFTFWVTPMFVFCGVFFEISRFPDIIQYVAWALPMTHMVATIRPLVAGTPIELHMILVHCGYIIAISVIAFIAANRKMRQRLFD